MLDGSMRPRRSDRNDDWTVTGNGGRRDCFDRCTVAKNRNRSRRIRASVLHDYLKVVSIQFSAPQCWALARDNRNTS